MKTGTKCGFILVATLLGGAVTRSAEPQSNLTTDPSGPNPQRDITRLAQLAGGTDAVAKPDNAGEKQRYLSPGVAEIVRMQEAGLDAPVIQAYIESSTVVHRVNADDLLYLHEHQIAPAAITALIKRGAELRSQAAQAQRESQNQMAQAQAQAQASPAVAAPTYAAPAQAAAPAYVYPSDSYAAYPTYGYGYGYAPSVYFGFGYPFYSSYCYRPYGYYGYRPYAYAGYRSYGNYGYCAPRAGYYGSVAFGTARYAGGYSAGRSGYVGGGSGYVGGRSGYVGGGSGYVGGRSGYVGGRSGSMMTGGRR